MYGPWLSLGWQTILQRQAYVIDLCSCSLGYGGCVQPGKMAVSLPLQKSYVGFLGHPPVPGAGKMGRVQRAVPWLHQHPLFNSSTAASAPNPLPHFGTMGGPSRWQWGETGPSRCPVLGHALSRREPVGVCSTAALFTAAHLPLLFITYFPSLYSK